MNAYRVMHRRPQGTGHVCVQAAVPERRARGTRTGTRLLTCWRQALCALAWFRDKPDIPRLGRGFGLSQATAYRYLDEAIGVLAEQAPGLHEALERAKDEGLAHLILDGKVVDTDRVKIKTISRKGMTIDLWFSGKTHGFGRNIQAIFASAGIPLWVCDVLSGNVHDLARCPQARGGLLDEGSDAVSLARFIASQKASHRVPYAVCCRALGVSQSWFWKWHHRPPTAAGQRRAAVDQAIAAAFGRVEGHLRVTAHSP